MSEDSEDLIRVLLVDDHALFRAGLVVLLKKVGTQVEVLEEGTGASAVKRLEQDTDFDLVILDYNLQDTNGIDLLKFIKQNNPELPVILLSANIDAHLIQLSLREHASGFITKTSTPDVMVSAVQLVLNGGVYIPPEAIGSQKTPNNFHYDFSSPASVPQRNGAASASLTQRQMDVLEQMKGGLSNKEIAKALSMSPSTVKVHVAAILKELQASTRTQAVFIAKDSGLLD